MREKTPRTFVLWYESATLANVITVVFGRKIRLPLASTLNNTVGDVHNVHKQKRRIKKDITKVNSCNRNPFPTAKWHSRYSRYLPLAFRTQQFPECNSFPKDRDSHAVTITLPIPSRYYNNKNNNKWFILYAFISYTQFGAPEPKSGWQILLYEVIRQNITISVNANFSGQSNGNRLPFSTVTNRYKLCISPTPICWVWIGAKTYKNYQTWTFIGKTQDRKK